MLFRCAFLGNIGPAGRGGEADRIALQTPDTFGGSAEHYPFLYLYGFLPESLVSFHLPKKYWQVTW